MAGGCRRRRARSAEPIRPPPISACATTPAAGSGIALGYKDADGWTTEGWWNLSARTCETLVKGQLVARFYYVYAVDYDRGGEWSGKAFMCTRDKEFTIRGIEDCLARGYDRTGFFEVDTTEQRSWTVQLTESTEQAPQQPLPQYTPLIPRASSAGPAEADQMRRLRRTKIVATLGPASSDQAMIARLFEAGADVFRINMSHTSHDAMRKLHAAIRAVEKESGRPIGILADLQGPKLRVGTFKSDARDARRRARPSCSTTTRRRATRRACTCRIRRSSRRSSRATRCCSTTARCGSRRSRPRRSAR